MFTTWLLDQDDREDSVGLLARTAKSDINNGCSRVYPYATDWLHHFKDRHSKQLPKLMEPLGDAYVEYCTTFDERKQDF